MPRWAKLTTGLAAALLAGWVHHGPYGGGARFIDHLEQRARLRLRVANVSTVSVRMQRDPLARQVILSGRADTFQKNGLGSYPGINERMRTIPGVTGVRWEGEAR